MNLKELTGKQKSFIGGGLVMIILLIFAGVFTYQAITVDHDPAETIDTNSDEIIEETQKEEEVVEETEEFLTEVLEIPSPWEDSIYSFTVTYPSSYTLSEISGNGVGLTFINEGAEFTILQPYEGYPEKVEDDQEVVMVEDGVYRWFNEYNFDQTGELRYQYGDKDKEYVEQSLFGPDPVNQFMSFTHFGEAFLYTSCTIQKDSKLNLCDELITELTLELEEKPYERPDVTSLVIEDKMFLREVSIDENLYQSIEESDRYYFKKTGLSYVHIDLLCDGESCDEGLTENGENSYLVFDITADYSDGSSVILDSYYVNAIDFIENHDKIVPIGDVNQGLEMFPDDSTGINTASLSISLRDTEAKAVIIPTYFKRDAIASDAVGEHQGTRILVQLISGQYGPTLPVEGVEVEVLHYDTQEILMSGVSDEFGMVNMYSETEVIDPVEGAEFRREYILRIVDAPRNYESAGSFDIQILDEIEDNKFSILENESADRLNFMVLPFYIAGEN